MLIFEEFLRLKWQTVATFSETGPASTKKYLIKKGTKNSKSFKNYEFIWSHYFVFALH